MDNSKRLEEVVNYAAEYASGARTEFLTPEHILYAIIVKSAEFSNLAKSYNVDLEYQLMNPLRSIFVDYGMVPDDVEYELELSVQGQQLVSISGLMAAAAGKAEMDIPHVLHAIMQLEDSYAKYHLLAAFNIDETELLRSIVDVYDGRLVVPNIPVEEKSDDEEEWMDEYPFYQKEESTPEWKSLVTCVNDRLSQHNPLIGREEELERTVQVLCRCDKNNPLHVGEPGVGKTALIYGLAQLIEDGKVPERLKGARIYQLDMGTLVAGTSYRGQFEERVNKIMEGVKAEGNAIVYIDEIHNLIGAGATSDGSLDGSNMLKPYLEAGDIRFIGSTTYKEFNRYFQQSQGMVRRFQKIDIHEPSQEEAINILKGLKARYEGFHKVQYSDGVVEHVVKMSARYMPDRFLPDKAIDLIDEAGAYRELHPLMRKYKGELRVAKKQPVDTDIINDIVRRICNISEQAMEVSDSGTEELATLAQRIQSQIYGQDEAIRLTTEAVMMGKAGLLDADKPVASMLFVGPTGVGKTEVCRVLAKELGIELVRFDMSEYTEKHTVAKLIGSPAGYVGYEDGGLLTDAIRKTPNCVLLIDEIEKAHPDIYNILLQVMDYARLTDNKGQQADFHHVILIMTSNAGAQYASQASVGFASKETAGTAMLQAVKKTFKPEFLGRLSATVVFNDMTKEMARQILDKKLGQLHARLAARNVTMQLSDEAADLLLQKGFTQKTGARELDRTINAMLTPMLTHEILFGRLKNGGSIIVKSKDDKLYIESLIEGE